MSIRPLMIGISPRIRKQAPAEMGLHDKAMQFVEESFAHWIQSLGALAMLVPAPEPAGGVRTGRVDATDYAAALDGLVLQGGKDISPQLYGQGDLHIIGEPDLVRDTFELDLVRSFHALGKPVFGICRGMQLINVAFGGTLYQDLELQGASGFTHVDRPLYDDYHHDVTLAPDSVLSHWYDGLVQARVNSIHHQGLARLADGFEAMAWASDGVIEAFWHRGESFVLGVQWHPEFQDGRDPSLLPADPLMQAFLDAAMQRRDARAHVAA